MGRITTPTFRLEFNDNPWRLVWNAKETWDCTKYGRPSTASIERFRVARHKSLEIGGVNEHISKSIGYIPYINRARIIRQATGETVAEFTAPPFEVV